MKGENMHYLLAELRNMTYCRAKATTYLDRVLRQCRGRREILDTWDLCRTESSRQEFCPSLDRMLSAKRVDILS